MLYTQKRENKNQSLERLIDALVLAVTAPSDEQSDKALKIAVALAETATRYGATELDIWMAKETADSILKTGQAHNI